MILLQHNIYYTTCTKRETQTAFPVKDVPITYSVHELNMQGVSRCQARIFGGISGTVHFSMGELKVSGMLWGGIKGLKVSGTFSGGKQKAGEKKAKVKSKKGKCIVLTLIHKIGKRPYLSSTGPICYQNMD